MGWGVGGRGGGELGQDEGHNLGLRTRFDKREREREDGGEFGRETEYSRPNDQVLFLQQAP